jgi:hypothetical protein
MKEENKIPLDQLRAALEHSMNQQLKDNEWENLLYGWRHKVRKQKAYTDKGWLTLADAQSLEQYACYPMLNQ